MYIHEKARNKRLRLPNIINKSGRCRTRFFSFISLVAIFCLKDLIHSQILGEFDFFILIVFFLKSMVEQAALFDVTATLVIEIIQEAHELMSAS